MSEFSGGPWFRVHSKKPKFATEVFIKSKPSGDFVAKAYGFNGEPVQANAALICAAPDMAQALRDVFNSKGEWAHLSPELQDRIERILDRVYGGVEEVT